MESRKNNKSKTKPEIKLVYQQVVSDPEKTKKAIERAFDILFEYTLKNKGP
ncbi:MAG: hypothetical protein WC757_02130 [Candidatus Paceibacterota bacterium]